jgi:hypothetical protein
MHADEACFERVAVAEMACDSAVEIVRFRKNPAVGADDGAQAGVFAIALHANDAGRERVNNFAKSGDKLRIGAQKIVGLRERDRRKKKQKNGGQKNEMQEGP